MRKIIISILVLMPFLGINAGNKTIKKAVQSKNVAAQPFGRMSEWMAWSEMKRCPNPIYLDFTDPKKRPQGKWNYGTGLELESILDCYNAYGDTIFSSYVRRYCDQMVINDTTVTGYKYSEFNLDNVRPARCLARCNDLFPSKKIEAVLPMFLKQLENQPRTKSGVWWHKAIYANQVWLDGIYMGIPYYTYIAEKLRGKDGATKIYDDTVDQISKTFKQTFDQKTGLWKHAWDETHSMFWANKETGLAQHTWARAMGWFVMSMTEVLDVLPQDYARRGEVVDMLNKAMTAALRYQDKSTHTWYDVLDVEGNPKNYLESTASAMFTYVLLKGTRLGNLHNTADIDFRAEGVKAYNGLVHQFIKINPDHTISLTNCCAVSGLGPNTNKKRDGSFDYYISEEVRDNDVKGIGPFIWASLEMEK